MVPDLINPTFIVLLHVVLVLWLSWIYFRRYQMTRPPIGVFNLGDIALMLIGIVLIPYLYLYLPYWLVVGLLLLGAGSILYFTFEPILLDRRIIWLVTGLLIFAEVGAVGRYGRQSPAFFFVNNAVQSLSVIGVTVLWAQSGMKARDAAILGLGLTIYDFLFTTQLALMSDLFARLATLPFAPLIAWPLANSHLWLGIGLGDLLLAAGFPLVMRKAFGRTAGGIALGLGLGALTLLLLLPLFGQQAGVFPVMAVLGPLLGLQYGYWRHQQGPERTTRQYWQAEPLPNRIIGAPIPPVHLPPYRKPERLCK